MYVNIYLSADVHAIFYFDARVKIQFILVHVVADYF